jgi:hypothetical protein
VGAVLGEQLLRLILKQVHAQSPLFPLLISLSIRSVKILVAVPAVLWAR